MLSRKKKHVSPRSLSKPQEQFSNHKVRPGNETSIVDPSIDEIAEFQLDDLISRLATHPQVNLSDRAIQWIHHCRRIPSLMSSMPFVYSTRSCSFVQMHAI